MKQELSARFDYIMANLRQAEPSPSFEHNFASRFSEAVARRQMEPLPARVFGKIDHFIRDLGMILSYRRRMLARVTASFLITVSAGAYIYSSQPSCPYLMSKSGDIRIIGGNGSIYGKGAYPDKLIVGDVIYVDPSGQLDLGIPDRYIIRMKGASKLRVASLTPRIGKGMAEFELIEGNVLVNVEDGFKGSRFTINTDSATATALGTKFSVDARSKGKALTGIRVLEGKVVVKSRHHPRGMALARQVVTVDAGQKTEVVPDGIPSSPQRMMEDEWDELDELYGLGKKPHVMLLIKNTPGRAKELLGPCPIIISDERPRQIPRKVDRAMLRIGQAVQDNDRSKHLESIRMLESIVKEEPNPKYNVQFLLYIGSYYEYLSLHEEAIKVFEGVVKDYPDSPLASIGACAIGIIYDEKLGDRDRAEKAYRAILSRYPNSLEAIWAEERLGIKKESN